MVYEAQSLIVYEAQLSDAQSRRPNNNIQNPYMNSCIDKENEDKT